ncbi:hypothetical protein [Geodermatophilus sp. SYSU D00815]
MITSQYVSSTSGSSGSRIIEEVRQMGSAQIVAALDEARNSSSAEITERQRRQRRQRAEQAAARFRTA